MAIASTFFVLAAFMNGRRNAFVSDRLIEMVIAKATNAKSLLVLVVLETRALAFMDMAPNPILPHIMEERNRPTPCILLLVSFNAEGIHFSFARRTLDKKNPFPPILRLQCCNGSSLRLAVSLLVWRGTNPVSLIELRMFLLRPIRDQRLPPLHFAGGVGSPSARRPLLSWKHGFVFNFIDASMTAPRLLCQREGQGKNVGLIHPELPTDLVDSIELMNTPSFRRTASCQAVNRLTRSSLRRPLRS